MFRRLLSAIALIASAALAGDVVAQSTRPPADGMARAVGQRPHMAPSRLDGAMPDRAQAEMPPSREPNRQEMRSLSEAVRSVQRRTGGQILGAERVPYEGGVITRIKYMDDRGRVRYMDDPGGPGERRSRAPRRADNDER